MSNPKFLTRASSFMRLLPPDKQAVPEPSQDSFFYRAFNANLETANSVMNTSYLQSMAVGTLVPDYYGQLTVLDSYYCYRAAETLKSLLCKVDKAVDPALYDLITDMIKGYDNYNDTFLNNWHIRESDSVTPTKTMHDYAEHEHNTMCYDDPIYTLVAYIPCYYLWPWFSQKIMEQDGFNKDGIYSYWFAWNYEDDNSYKSAWRIGNLIEAWKAAGKEFDEDKALDVYSKSMQFELQVFTEADAENTEKMEVSHMSTSKTFNVGAITKGMYMSWFITSQAANRITVKLFDDKKVYFEASKQSIDIDPPLAQGAAFVDGDNLKIQITSSGHDELQTWHNMSDISSASGDTVGKVFTLSGEDYIDNDYNDVYVSLSAWNKAH